MRGTCIKLWFEGGLWSRRVRGISVENVGE